MYKYLKYNLKQLKISIRYKTKTDTENKLVETFYNTPYIKYYNYINIPMRDFIFGQKRTVKASE